jgi:hypothetical protein
MPDMFDNRRADNWRLLLAIAEAGDDWDNQARSGATKILRPTKVASPPTLTPGRWINPNPRSSSPRADRLAPLPRLDACGAAGSPAPPRKGNRLERAPMRLLQAHGFAAARVLLSGAADCRFSGDLAVPVPRRDLRVEVKTRAARGGR